VNDEAVSPPRQHIEGIDIPANPVERRKFFFAVLRADQERKARRRAELAELVKTIPVPDDLLSEIAWGWSDLLKNHPGFEAYKKSRALSAMLAVFNRAHKDLVAQLERFHEFTLTEDFGRRRGKRELQEIGEAVDKELLAFSTAAMSLVDHARGLRDLVLVTEFEERRSAIFDVQEHRFITELRNMISHGHFPDVSWHLQYGEERITDFILFSSNLLDYGGIHKDAQAFIARCGEHVHVRRVTDSYAAKVRLFYDWYYQKIESNVPEALIDYRRCRRVCTVTSSRSWHRVLVHHFIEWKVDPYQHLDKYLLPEERDVAMKIPMRSKEQVDYIISTADEHDACDDELRSMIYRLFGVTTQR